jgi:hypothetical protein
MAESCAPPPLIFPPRVDRLPLIREAFRLEWLTIGWMTIEAVIAIAAGVTAGSLVLLAFGLDSVIELASAGVLMWRLSVELRYGQKFSERAERVAGRISGGLLFVLGGLRHGGGSFATMERNWRRILMAGLYRRPGRYSCHALSGARQDQHRCEDRKPRAPCRRDGSLNMRMVVVRGYGQSRCSMASGRVVD